MLQYKGDFDAVPDSEGYGSQAENFDGIDSDNFGYDVLGQ
jgi:hypothetical protein